MTQLIKDGTIIDANQFPALYPDLVLPYPIQYSDFGWSVVFPTPQPTLSNSVTKRVQPDAPILTDKGHWEQTWIEVDVYSDYTDAKDVLHTKAEQEAAAIAADTATKIAALQANIISETQKRLDTFATTRGYDNIVSACSYATSTSKYGTEGKYCVTAREATWDAVFAIQAEVLAGTRAAPSSFADIEAELPPLVWPV
jgi:hypothetical protein